MNSEITFCSKRGFKMKQNYELAWETDSYQKRTFVASQFARYALNMDFNEIPQDVVHTAKRVVLDSLACAIAASESPGRPVIESVISEIGGNEVSTLFGCGKKTSMLNAALLNS